MRSLGLLASAKTPILRCIKRPPEAPRRNAHEGSENKENGDLIMQSTMTASGFATAAHTAPRTAPSKPKVGLFATIYSGLVAGQEARARAIVRQHMAMYDDAQLEALGWSKAEITALRTR
jgi:hypothetical protein